LSATVLNFNLTDICSNTKTVIDHTLLQKLNKLIN